jgi:DNA-binding SARP family transcriptional activator
MEQVNIQLLGTPRIYAGSAPVALPRRRTRALLYYLSAEPQPHSREEIAALIWPDLDPAKARRQLSDALADLRRTLGAGIVQADSETISWAGPPSDVARLGALITDANRGPADAAALLADASSLYAGEFLAGVHLDGAEAFEEWLADARLRLNLDALAAIARLARLRLDAGQYTAALDAATSGLAFDPLREDLWRLLIEARAASGDREGALQDYVRCRDTLQRELGVAPEPETEALRRRFSAEPGSIAASVKEIQAARARPPLPFALRLPPGALPLTGREKELGTLLRYWNEASSSGGLALIVGEPGIGKTRLATEFAARVVADGGLTLGARCPDLADPPPHGPFEEALRAALPAVQQGELASLGEWLPWAGRLLPELGLGFPTVGSVPPDEERSRLSEAAVRLLSIIAAGRPLLLILEDLHWAHPATVSLLHRLARRDWPALVLGTFRDTEPQTPGSTALLRVAADLAAEHRIQRLNLGPLPLQVTESLVRTALSTAGSRVRTRPAAVAEISEGHPLFAIELTRALIEAPDDPDLPETLTTAIRARMERASEQARRVLELAVVFGHPLSTDLLARASGLDPNDESLIAAIEELLARRLLKEEPGSSGHISPSHGLVTAAVYESLSAPRRRALHARAAAALESGPGPTSGDRMEALLRHYRLAGQLDRAAGWATKAAERALSLGEPQTALARYRSAAHLLLRAGQDVEAALALEKGGDATMGSCESTNIAGDAFMEALNIVDSLGEEKALKTRLHRKLSELMTRWGYCGIGRLERATTHISKALALLDEDGDNEERGRVLASRAFMRAFEDDVAGAEEDARRSLTLVPPDSFAWLQSMDALSGAVLAGGRAEEALEVDERRIPVALRLGDPLEINDAYRMSAFSAAKAGRLGVAEEYARLSLDSASRGGLDSLLRSSRTHLADALLQNGKVDEAAEILEDLVADPATETDLSLQPPLRRALLAHACALQGDADRARSLLAEAQTYPGFHPTHFFGWLGDVEARVLAAVEAAEVATVRAS